MKKLLLAALLGLSATAYSQYYYNSYVNAGHNPGSLNSDDEYPVGGGLDVSWTTIHNPSASPAWSTAQNIPFSFNFNGSPVTQYKVSNSGVLTFDVASAVAAPSFTASAIPSASIPDNAVCIWGLSGTGTNDYVVMKNFGTAPNRQHWIFFTSYTTPTSYTYWSIVLEETTNNIYIVDQRSGAQVTGLAAGIQINSTTAYALNGGSNNVTSLSNTDPTPGDNSYYQFIPGNRPAYDVAGSSDNVNPYLVLSQAPFNIGGTFVNFGSTTVNAVDVNYSVNNGPTVSGTVGSLNAATQATLSATCPTGWTPSISGTYNIKMWASNINGNADMLMSNDTVAFTVTVVDTMTVRNTCLEVFTSSTCGPCAAGNANFESNIIPNISNYTVVKYQQDFPGAGDPYNTTETVARRAYYNINSIPRMEIDGQWDGNAQIFTVPIFNSYQQEPAFTEISINNATYNGTTANVTGTIKPLITYAGSNFAYHVVIVEKQTVNNVATNGETSFENVAMDMIPNQNGTAVSALTAMNVINFTKTSNLSTSHVEQMGDLRAVVFLQDNTTKKILQSAWTDIILNGIAHMDAEGEGIVRVFPNPSTDVASMRFRINDNAKVSYSLISTLGQKVMDEQVNASVGDNYVNISTSNLSEGIYYLNLYIGEKVFSQKLIIAH